MSLGGGGPLRPLDPGPRVGWGRTHLYLEISTRRRQLGERGQGMGRPLLGAFSFSGLGRRGGGRVLTLCLPNIKTMSKVLIKEGRRGDC